MKYGVIKIVGVIGKGPMPDGSQADGVDLIEIIDQVKKAGPVDEYAVLITSPGGFVEVGKSIHDYLRGLSKAGKPVSTIGISQVASIAMNILLAGDPSKRYVVDGIEGLAHNPWGGKIGTAAELAEAAESLAETEDEMLSFYSKATGTPKEGLKPLMDAEHYLTADQMVSLGFADKKITQAEADAYGVVTTPAAKLRAVAISSNKKKSKPMTDKKTILKKFAAFLTSIGIESDDKTVALDLKTTDGKSVTIEKDPADPTPDVPMVGDAVMVDGAAAPNAVLALEDGSVIELDGDSKIASIEASTKETEEGANAQEKLAKAVAKAKVKATALIEKKKQKTETPEEKKAREDHAAAVKLALAKDSPEFKALQLEATSLITERDALRAEVAEAKTSLKEIERKFELMARQVESKFKADKAVNRFRNPGVKMEEKAGSTAAAKRKQDLMAKKKK